MSESTRLPRGKLGRCENCGHAWSNHTDAGCIAEDPFCEQCSCQGYKEGR